MMWSNTLMLLRNVCRPVRGRRPAAVCPVITLEGAAWPTPAPSCLGIQACWALTGAMLWGSPQLFPSSDISSFVLVSVTKTEAWEPFQICPSSVPLVRLCFILATLALETMLDSHQPLGFQFTLLYSKQFPFLLLRMTCQSSPDLAHACDLCTWEAEARGPGVQGQLGLCETVAKNN